MKKSLGFIGVVIEDRKKEAGAVNKIFSDLGGIIVARMGIPYKERGCFVISLVIDATTDEMKSLTGRLGAVPGVSVKSGAAKTKKQ
jgi:putative iron-only hydrogenase system regulator